MTLEAPNVRIGITGHLSVAPAGSTTPTDATTALDAAFVDLGYLSTDALNLDHNDSSTDHVAWQNGDIVRNTIDQSTYTLDFTCIEFKTDVLKQFYEGSTFSAGHVVVKSFKPTKKLWVLDVEDGDVKMRYLFRSAQIVSRGAVPIANSTIKSYPMSLRLFKDGDDYLDLFTDSPALV